jgi:hypothetical protein
VAVTIFAPFFEMSITWHSAIVRSCSFIHADRWRVRRISRTTCFVGFGILQICPQVKHCLKASREKAGGRYTVGFFLRLPALFSGATAFARDCNDMVNERLTATLPSSISSNPRRRFIGRVKLEAIRALESSPTRWTDSSRPSGRTRSGSPTSPASGRSRVGSVWPP